MFSFGLQMSIKNLFFFKKKKGKENKCYLEKIKYFILDFKCLRVSLPSMEQHNEAE